MSRSLDSGKNLFQNYPDVVNVNDMSLMLGISKKLAYRLVAQGEIGSVKVGRSYKIPKAYVVQYLT